MRLQHIIEQVYCRPWLITEAGHAAIRGLLESKLADSFPREGEDFWTGEKEDLPGMEIKNGIATIPIQGVIAQKVSRVERSCGAVDVRDISKELAIAEAREDVTGIVLDIDSPGGTVGGTPELADEIAAAEKPVFAWTDSMMASAAYWLGASADQVYTSPTAEVGSIGVYMPWRDSSKMMEDRGIKTEIFRAGRYKGMGYPGTSLTDDQRKLLQAQVDDIYAMFTGHVNSKRQGGVSKEAMQGQSFMAKKALQENLVDGIMRSRSDVERMLR